MTTQDPFQPQLSLDTVSLPLPTQDDIWEERMPIEFILDHLAIPLATQPEPDSDFLNSLRTWGQRDAILLASIPNPNDETPRYRLIDGRRRLLGAMKLEWFDIKVRLYQMDELLFSALSIDANINRSANPLSEYEAILEFMNTCNLRGIPVNEKTIHQATGMPIQTIRKRLKLGNLSEKMYQACKENKLTIGVAEDICKLPRHQQERLEEVLEDFGKVTIEDVKSVKQVGYQTAATTLPLSISEPPKPMTREIYIVLDMSETLSPVVVYAGFDREKMTSKLQTSEYPTHLSTFPVEL